MKDRYLTVRETAEQAEISTGSAHAILCDLIRRATSKFVLTFLSIEHKEFRLAVALGLLDTMSAESVSLRFQAIPEIKMSLKGSRF
ncbi:hypothetical protein TNCV_3564851 [Trichonephila clavipes]|nr:hypothetical protein TNCV_3564851 [Trichonephila clavipes]